MNENLYNELMNRFLAKGFVLEARSIQNHHGITHIKERYRLPPPYRRNWAVKTAHCLTEHNKVEKIKERSYYISFGGWADHECKSIFIMTHIINTGM